MVKDIDTISRASLWLDLREDGYGVMDYTAHPTDVFAGFDYTNSYRKPSSAIWVRHDKVRRATVEYVRTIFDSLPEEHRGTALDLMLYAYKNGAEMFCEL